MQKEQRIRRGLDAKLGHVMEENAQLRQWAIEQIEELQGDMDVEIRRLVDVVPVPEPLWSQHGTRLRAVARASESLPPLSNLVGVTTANMAAEQGNFIRAIIRGRRRAVEFMHQDPDAAGDIVARAYNVAPEVGRSAVRALTASRTEGVPYWGPGNFDMRSMQRMVELQRGIGGLTGEINLPGMIDTSFLPEDLRAPR